MKFYSSEMSICLADVNYFNLDPDSFAREKGGKVQNGGGGSKVHLKNSNCNYHSLK